MGLSIQDWGALGELTSAILLFLSLMYVCGIPDTADKKNNAGDSSLPPWQPAAVVQLVAPAKPAICVQKWC